MLRSRNDLTPKEIIHQAIKKLPKEKKVEPRCSFCAKPIDVKVEREKIKIVRTGLLPALAKCYRRIKQYGSEPWIFILSLLMCVLFVVWGFNHFHMAQKLNGGVTIEQNGKTLPCVENPPGTWTCAPK